jgi:hypothetical protein
MGYWEQGDGSTLAPPGEWASSETLKEGDEVTFHRSIPRPRWYRPVALWRWLRGDRTERMRLKVTEAYMHTFVTAPTAAGSQE